MGFLESSVMMLAVMADVIWHWRDDLINIHVVLFFLLCLLRVISSVA